MDAHGADREEAFVAASRLHRGRRGQLGQPIPIVAPGGAAAGWFVPSVDGDLIVGFHHLDPDLRPRRWSEFATAMEARSWVDPAAVAEVASRALQPEETLGTPFLTYDRNPDRLAWRVPVVEPAGSGAVMVAGGVAWRDGH